MFEQDLRDEELEYYSDEAQAERHFEDSKKPAPNKELALLFNILSYL